LRNNLMKRIQAHGLLVVLVAIGLISFARADSDDGNEANSAPQAPDTDSAVADAVIPDASDVPASFTSYADRLRNDPLMMPYYTGNIFPTPQKVDYRDEFIPMANVAIVVGKDVENPGPLVDVLVDRIVRYGGKAAVVPAPGAEHTAVVSLGDTEFARQAKDVPAVTEKEQGYILHATSVSGKPLIILKGMSGWGCSGPFRV